MLALATLKLRQFHSKFNLSLGVLKPPKTCFTSYGNVWKPTPKQVEVKSYPTMFSCKCKVLTVGLVSLLLTPYKMKST